MPEFSWQARTAAGALVRGRDDAADRAALLRALALKGLTVTGLSQELKKSAQRDPGAVRVSRKERIQLTQQLADALGAGISLIETLGEFARSHPKEKLRLLFEALLHQVEGGSMLGAAMERYPAVFPAHYVHAVRASERTGRLDRVFDELASELEWQDEMISRVTSAMVYPAILISAVGGVTLLFLTVLVPKFQPLFAMAGNKLPWSTRLLIAVSDALIQHWAYFVGAALALAVGVPLALRSRAGRRFTAALRLRLPLLRGVVRHYAIAGFARTAGTLLESGLALPESVAVAAAATGNEIFEKRLVAAREKVIAGRSLAEALSEAELLDPLDTRMVAVGEKTGALSTAFARLSSLHERTLRRSIQTMVTMIEPLLIVLMAAVVLSLALSIFLPIYSSLDGVGAK